MKKNINGISIVIPFHNEAKRILPLIDSLNGQTNFENCELIFVDDHSTDETVSIISQKLKLPHRLIQSSSKKGKKFALHEGINQANYDAILTLDADVFFEKNYLNELLKLELKDMIILPVKMTGNTFFQLLSSVEFTWLQVLTFSASNEVLCNGANLLFAKNAYQKVHELRTDFDKASGDDYFLLEALNQNGAIIRKKNTKSVRVNTFAPENWNELILQRRRWFNKTNSHEYDTENSFAVVLAVIQVFFIASCIMVWWYPLMAIALGIKFLTECIAAMNKGYLPFPKLLLVVLIHQFWYPIYLLGMIFYPKKVEQKWVTILNQ